MSTAEELFGDSIDANRLLKEAVQAKVGEYDKKVSMLDTLARQRLDQQQQDIADWKQKAKSDLDNDILHFSSGTRAEYGHVCITPNQKMNVSEDGLGVVGLSHYGVSLQCELKGTAYAKSSYDNNNDYAKDFLISIGNPYQNTKCNVVEVGWEKTDLSYNRFNNSWWDGSGSGVITEAAFVKVLSGEVGGSFTIMKEFANGWKLMGCHSGGNLMLSHTGLSFVSDTGKVLIAQYAKVTGYADLQSGKWQMFPSLLTS